MVEIEEHRVEGPVVKEGVHDIVRGNQSHAPYVGGE